MNLNKINLTHDLSACGKFWEIKPELKEVYRAALQDQLEKWVQGIDVHTTNLPAGIEPECTPDMACCSPESAWPTDMRLQFVAANAEDRHTMMIHGLAKLIKATLRPTCHVAGTSDTQH